MWHLSMIGKDEREWAPVGVFASLRDVARRIAEIEGYPVKGVFLRAHVESDYGTDAEALGHLEHSGQVGKYVVKRRVQ